MNGFWDFSLGNIITFLGVVVGYMALRREQARDIKKAAEDVKEAAENVNAVSQRRHEENLGALGKIREELAGMTYLHRDVADLKRIARLFARRGNKDDDQ